jgi:hypothetical protein
MRLYSLLLGLVLVSCQTTPPQPDPMPPPDSCRFAEVISSALTPRIADILGCQNPAAIKVDIIAQIHKTNICGETQQNVVIDIICEKVADIMLTTVMKQLPENWRCDGGKIGQMGKDKLAKACIDKLSNQ